MKLFPEDVRRFSPTSGTQPKQLLISYRLLYQHDLFRQHSATCRNPAVIHPCTNTSSRRPGKSSPTRIQNPIHKSIHNPTADIKDINTSVHSSGQAESNQRTCGARVRVRLIEDNPRRQNVRIIHTNSITLKNTRATVVSNSSKIITHTLLTVSKTTNCITAHLHSIMIIW